MASWTAYEFPSTSRNGVGGLHLQNPVTYIRRKSLEYLQQRKEGEVGRPRTSESKIDADHTGPYESSSHREQGLGNLSSVPPPAPLPTFLHSMVEVDSNLIIYGGCTTKGEGSAHISIFDTETLSYGIPEEEVILTEESAGPRYGHSSTLISTHPATLLIFGGMVGGTTFSFEQGGGKSKKIQGGKVGLKGSDYNKNKQYSSNFNSMFSSDDDEEEEELEFESYLDLSDDSSTSGKKMKDDIKNIHNNNNGKDMTGSSNSEEKFSNDSDNDNDNDDTILDEDSKHVRKRHEPIRRLSDCNVNYEHSLQMKENKTRGQGEEGNSIVYENKIPIRSTMLAFRQASTSASRRASRGEIVTLEKNGGYNNNKQQSRRKSLQEQINSLKENMTNYMGGGYSKSSGVNESLWREDPDNGVYLLECSSKSWKWSKPLVKVAPGHLRPLARSEHSATKIDANHILFFGGWCEGPLNDLHVLDIGKMEWSQPTLYSSLGTKSTSLGNWGNDIIVDGTKISTGSPSPRYRHTSVKMGNRILVFGGSDNSEDVAEYSEADDMNTLWALNLPLSDIELVEHKVNLGDEKKKPHHTSSSLQSSSDLLELGNKEEVEGKKLNMKAKEETKLHSCYSWSKLLTQGYSPLPRSGHSATQISPTTIAVFGGKKSNNEGIPYSSDVFLLDIESVDEQTNDEEEKYESMNMSKDGRDNNKDINNNEYEKNVESKSAMEFSSKKYNLYQGRRYIFRWTQVRSDGQVPRGLTGTTISAIDNKCYIFGGADYRNKCYNEIRVVEFKNLFSTNQNHRKILKTRSSLEQDNKNNNNKNKLFGSNSSNLIMSKLSNSNGQEERKDGSEEEKLKQNDIEGNVDLMDVELNDAVIDTIDDSKPFTKKVDMTFKIIVIGDSGVGKSSLLYRYTSDTFDVNYTSTLGIDYNSKIISVPSKMHENERGNTSTKSSKQVKLEIWDTAGQERFAGITGSYYRGAQGAMLVYDVTNRESYENISKWVDRLQRYGGPDMDIILVGNKIDLVAQEDDEKETRKVDRKRELDLFQIESFSDDDEIDVNEDNGDNHSTITQENVHQNKQNMNLYTREVSIEEGQQLALKLSSNTRTTVQFVETSAKLSINVNDAFFKMATSIKDRLEANGTELQIKAKGKVRLRTGKENMGPEGKFKPLQAGTLTSGGRRDVCC